MNNAGIEIAKPLVEITDEEFTRILDINVVGTFRFTRPRSPRSPSAGGAAIVNMASVAGTAGEPLLSAYCSSKGAVVRFQRIGRHRTAPRVSGSTPYARGSRRRKWPPTGRAHRSDSPIPFDDLITLKQGRFGTPDDVAEVVAFLASEDARFITGSHYLVDGGLTANLF